MIYTKYFIAIFWMLLVCGFNNGESVNSQQQQPTTIKVQSDVDDLQPEASNNIQEVQTLLQNQDKDVTRSETTMATNGFKFQNPESFVKPQVTRVTISQKHQLNHSLHPKKPAIKAKSRMAKPDVPMYYKIIKKVEYGPRKIQRRQGYGFGNTMAVANGHKMMMHPMQAMQYHVPHTVKFYIQPTHLKGPKGTKLFLPVVPQPGDKVPDWVQKQPGYVLARPKGPFKGLNALAQKKPKGNQFFTPAHIPFAGYQQPYQPYIQSHVKPQHKPEPATQAEDAAQVVPNWAQHSVAPQQPHQPQAVVPEFPDWSNLEHETSYDFDNDFNPAQYNNFAHFASPPAHNTGPFEGYESGVTAGFPQPQAPQALALQQRPYPQVSSGQYSVEEQTIDVPPPPGPMRRPPGSVIPAGPAQTPGLSASQQQQMSQGMMMQAQPQPQFAQMTAFQAQQQAQQSQQPPGHVGDIDYSAYQPKPAQIQHASAAYASAPANPNPYAPPVQAPQWSYPIPAEHNPNLQAAYDWRQNTQDGNVIHVTHTGQESRTLTTQVTPEGNHIYANHAPQHHQIARTEVGPTSAALISKKESNDEDEDSDDVISIQTNSSTEHQSVEDNSQEKKPTKVVPSSAPHKEGMISNGWTPIINN